MLNLLTGDPSGFIEIARSPAPIWFPNKFNLGSQRVKTWMFPIHIPLYTIRYFIVIPTCNRHICNEHVVI